MGMGIGQHQKKDKGGQDEYRDQDQN